MKYCLSVLCLAVCLAFALPLDASVEDSAEARLDALIERYLDDYWQRHPDRATRAGLSDWNDRLPDLRAEALAAEAEALRVFLMELAGIDPERLGSIDHRVDHDLMARHLRIRLAEIETLPRWRREPRLYLPFHAFNDLILDEFAPLEQRIDWLQARLDQLPTLLQAGQANLDRAPRRFVEDAIRSTESQLPFFRETVPAFAARVPERTESVQAAAAAAADAVEDYLVFLRADLLPRADGEVAVGREVYDFYLQVLHGLELDADGLIELGQRYYDEIEARLAAQAERIAPGRHWADVTEDIRDDHPTREDLLDAYCRDIQRSRAHVVERDLATVPPNEEVRCIHSDPSQRAFSPFGTFRTPAPFSESKIGYLILHPVPEGLSAEEETRRLRAHDFSWIEVIAPHEAYPGHHLQAILAQENPRPLRRVYSTPVFTEGWGLYTEELMHETGFFRTPEETRLTQLRLQLWRAARVLLDARLHTGQISVEEARDFLAEHIRMEYGATAGEVNIYVYRPSYAIGYVVGFYEMMALREQARAARGEDFELKAFHDEVLSLGSMPFPLVRELMALPPEP